MNIERNVAKRFSLFNKLHSSRDTATYNRVQEATRKTWKQSKHLYIIHIDCTL